MKEHAANLLTASRAVLIIPLVCLPLTSPAICWFVLVAYALLALTDFLDGHTARRLNQVSDLGKALDPVADRMMLLMFAPLLQLGYISVALFAVLWSREVLIFLLRQVATQTKRTVPSRRSGKWRTALIYVFATLLLLGVALQLPPAPSWFGFPQPVHADNLVWFAYDQLIVLLAWIIVGGTIYTLYDYGWAHRELIAKLWRNPRAPFASLTQPT